MSLRARLLRPRVAFGLGSAFMVVSCVGLVLAEPTRGFARSALHFADGMACGLALGFLTIGSLGLPRDGGRDRDLPRE